mmetsp:Transcript_4603/g.7174  ORF Transcript_4603/g.7174 Transcript_4603/m.7174 type:complete len:353 (+) Transcript_4603:153-1211(+)
MTTITHSLQGLKTVLERLPIGDEGGVPAEMMQYTHGVIFIRGLHAGRIKETKCPGVFIRKDAQGSWSKPVAIHFLEGTYNAKIVTDRMDCLILINDVQSCCVLEAMGQIGFNKDAYPIEEGPVVGTDKWFSMRQQLKSDPSVLSTKAFSYLCASRKVYSCNLLSPAFQFRPSSNEKFYNSRNATLKNIIQGTYPFTIPAAGTKLLDAVNGLLTKRFPTTKEPAVVEEQKQDSYRAHASTYTHQENEEAMPPVMGRPYADSTASTGWGGAPIPGEYEEPVGRPYSNSTGRPYSNSTGRPYSNSAGWGGSPLAPPPPPPPPRTDDFPVNDKKSSNERRGDSSKIAIASPSTVVI